MRVLENGCAYWSLGSIVSVGLCGPPHDPNYYRARCLTAGTFPLVQILDEKYPEPLQALAINTPVVIHRELAESEEAEQEATEAEVAEAAEAEAAEEAANEAVREEQGMFVIVGCKAGNIRVVRKGHSEKTIQDDFDSVEDARDWINRNECEGCGRLKVESSNNCPLTHIGAPETFSF